MAQVFKMKLIKQGPKEQKLGLRTGHICHLASFMVGYLIVLSNPAVLGYMVSSFQLISLQLSKKGEHSGAGERSKAMPTPTSHHSCHPSESSMACRGKMAARRSGEKIACYSWALAPRQPDSICL